MPRDPDDGAEGGSCGGQMKSQAAKLTLFVAIFVLGVVNIVVTLANGGGITSVGILFGALLCALAVGRIWISLKGIG